jgi:hypothetical protein
MPEISLRVFSEDDGPVLMSVLGVREGRALVAARRSRAAQFGGHVGFAHVFYHVGFAHVLYHVGLAEGLD